MTSPTFMDHLLEGDHASRPAANTVPEGTLYACSDHGLIYQSDLSSWATWATLGETGAAAHIADTTDAHDASAISADTTGFDNASGDDVQEVLGELDAAITAAVGGGLIGQPVALTPPHPPTMVDASTMGVAQVAFAVPIIVPAAMKVRGLSMQISSAGAGSIQWGLFDYSSSASAATKLAGGSAAPGGTGWRSIAAASAPVDVAAGCYMLVVMNPSSNQSTWRVLHDVNSVALPFVQQWTTYTWDDTPDFTSASWAGASNWPHLVLEGDLDGSGNRWT